jgi:hypothetical protein
MNSSRATHNHQFISDYKALSKKEAQQAYSLGPAL